MTVLVFGASGLLGSNVVDAYRDQDKHVVGTYHTTEPALGIDCHQCDLTDFERSVAILEQIDPEIVINCAAMTDVDECQREPEAATGVNADAPGHIAGVCSNRDIDLVHVSTDYVFDGNNRTPYHEDDDPEPLQVYGRTKLEGERAVRNSAPEALTVRLSFVYGVHRSSGGLTGFPAWVRNELKADNEVPLFTDQYVTPSRAGQAAETIVELSTAGASGTFHVACRDCVTPYDFGRRIAKRTQTNGSVLKSSRTDIDREAPRPAYSCLDVSKVEETLGRSQPTIGQDMDALAF